MAQEAYANCRFYVEISGIPQAVFTEVSGLQVETEFEEYREGGNNDFVHCLPGPTKVSRLTLKRGMTGSNDFFRWYLEILQGKMTSRNISVVMYDAQGKELIRWNFAKAYPVKWIGPQFTADGTVVAVETLEFAHEGLTP